MEITLEIMLVDNHFTERCIIKMKTMYKVLIRIFYTQDSPRLSFTSHCEGRLQFSSCPCFKG